MASEAVYQRNDDLPWSQVGDDIVGLNIARGECFGLADVAGRIWDLLQSPQTAASLCERLCEEYEVDRSQCLSDVSDFLRQMVRDGLVKRID